MSRCCRAGGPAAVLAAAVVVVAVDVVVVAVAPAGSRLLTQGAEQHLGVAELQAPADLAPERPKDLGTLGVITPVAIRPDELHGCVGRTAS